MHETLYSYHAVSGDPKTKTYSCVYVVSHSMISHNINCLSWCIANKLLIVSIIAKMKAQ